MNQPTTADIIKVVGQLLSEARELQELKKGLNRDYAPAELARMEERLARAQSLLSQLCKDPVLAPTIWNPYPEVKPTAGRDYLVWIKDGGAGWQDQPAVEKYSSRLQDFEGESPIIEDGGLITHWAEITAPQAAPNKHKRTNEISCRAPSRPGRAAWRRNRDGGQRPPVLAGAVGAGSGPGERHHARDRHGPFGEVVQAEFPGGKAMRPRHDQTRRRMRNECHNVIEVVPCSEEGLRGMAENFLLKSIQMAAFK